MAQWAWKLVVTTLGTHEGALEAVVSADNWLSALRAGRKEIGEEGGVPQGASCVMSATGDVTILDAARRRRYVLVRAVPAEAIAADEPDARHADELSASRAADVAQTGSTETEAATLERAAAEPPVVGPSTKPSPEATPDDVATAASDAPADVGTPAPGTPPIGASAGEPAVPPAASAVPPAGPEHALASDSIAPESSAGPMPASRPPAALASARIEAAAPTEPHAQAEPVAAGEAAPSEPSLPRAKQTLAYSALRAQALKREFETSRQLVSPGAPSTPVVGAPEPEGGPNSPRPSLHAVPPEQRGVGPASSIPPAPKLPADVQIRQPGDSTKPRRSMPTAPRFDGLVPLASRDVDPTPQSPLTYRERSYLVARSADRERLEGLLQAQFVAVRRELVGKPRGQLIHLAVFDHSFDDKPSRPPIATLEWRDWRGNAVFVMAGETGPENAAPTTAAPRAPESSWPVPMRGHAAVSATQVPRSSWPTAGQEAARGGRASGAPVQPNPVPATPFDAVQPAAASAAPPTTSGQVSAFGPAVAEVNVSPRSSSAPPAGGASTSAASWPIPPQTPLEPARVLSAAWPVAPVPAPQPRTSYSDAPAHTGGVLAPAHPFSPASAWPPASEVASPIATRAPVGDPFGPPVARPSAADVFAPLPARPAASDPFGPPAPAPSPKSAADDLFTPPPARASDSFGPFDARRDPTGENDSRLATAFEAMPDLYFLPTPVAGLEFTLQLINRLVPSEAISGCLYDINSDVFRFVVLTGPGAIERRAGSVPSQAGLFGVAKRDMGEAFVVRDVTAEPRYDDQADGREGLEAKTLAYLPVRFGGQLLGMMQLINRENERGFSTSDVAVLTYVTAQLAEFLATRRSLMG